MTKTSMRAGEDSVVSTHIPTAAEYESQSQEAQHSPLPWRVQYENGRPIVMSEGYYVTTTALSPGNWDSKGREQYSHKANAEFIVRATGAYYQFRAALMAIAAGTEAPADVARRALDGDRE